MCVYTTRSLPQPVGAIVTPATCGDDCLV